MTTDDRLLLLVVGPPAEAAGLTSRLSGAAVDVRVCADAAEAVRVLKDAGSAGDRPVRVGGLRLFPSAQEAELHGRRIALPPREFRLLHLLAVNAGEVVSRGRIRDVVWNAPEDGSNTITVHVQRLRVRLGDHRQHPEIIRTVRRLGYRLVPPPKTPLTG